MSYIWLTVAAAALSVAQAEPPASPQWVLTGDNGDGVLDYVDVASIERDGDTVTVWHQARSDRPLGVDSGLPFDEATARTAIHCASRTYLDLHLTFRLEGKELISFAPEPDPQEIEPGSLGDDLYRYVCNVAPEDRSV